MSGSCWGHQGLEAALAPHRYWSHPVKDTVCESLANRRPASWVSHLGKYWCPHPPLPTCFPASGLGIKNLTSVLRYEISQVLRKEKKRLPLCHMGHDFFFAALTVLSVSLARSRLFLELLPPYCLPTCPACGINNASNKLYLPPRLSQCLLQTPSETLQ